MSVAFQRGTTTGANDLNITVRNPGGSLIDPYRLEYAIFDNTTGVEVLIGSPVNTPNKASLGQYYAPVMIPADANLGDWLIRWTIQETSVDPVYQSVQEFNVIGDGAVVSFTGDPNLDGLIWSLRILLRDSNPDRNYRFRPPASEKFIQGQTQVFGFIWEDEELLEYIYMAVDDFNTRPPVTGIIVSDIAHGGSAQRWRTAVLLRAASFAMFAIALNWIADEFSVGGEEKITVRTDDGEEATLTIEELFSIVHEENMEVVRANLAEAFKRGGLQVKSFNRDTGEVEWKDVKHVLRHNSIRKRILQVSAQDKSVVVTEDHSLFSWKNKVDVKASELSKGDEIVVMDGESVAPAEITEIEELEKREYMYDLSVPGNENFFLESGILAHNSYSISGVSLDIEKSSKYMGMKDQFIGEYDKVVEAAKRSIKIIKGLRQFRYGVGITSALGPLNRPGVQSRRNWVSSGGPSWS